MFFPSTVRRGARVAPVLAACTGLALLSGAARAEAVEVTGSAAITTDYVFRGITQTQGDPAVQLGPKVATGNGFYGNVWGSTVEFAGDTGASNEFDYSIGWGGNLADDWALDVNLTHFDYPSARIDLAYTELIGTLTYQDNYWAMVGYSADVFATDAQGIYAQVGTKFPINDRLRFEAAVAHYDLDDAYGKRYSHGSLGAVWAFKTPDSRPGIELRVTVHGSDSNAKDIFPGLAGSRAEAALQASF
ncbi:MAG: TorF family putative porin [Luteimonas sp.]